MTRADREIAARYRMVGELLGKTLVRCIGLRHHQQAARVLVDAVDDAGTLDPVDARQLAAAVVEQGIDQRAFQIAGSRVHDHSGGLVDHQEVVVLEHDVERDVLRGRIERLGWGQGDAPVFLAPDLGGRRFRHGLADRHRALGDERLDPFARQATCLGKHLVEAAGLGQRSGEDFWLGHARAMRDDARTLK